MGAPGRAKGAVSTCVNTDECTPVSANEGMQATAYGGA